MNKEQLEEAIEVIKYYSDLVGEEFLKDCEIMNMDENGIYDVKSGKRAREFRAKWGI